LGRFPRTGVNTSAYAHGFRYWGSKDGLMRVPATVGLLKWRADFQVLPGLRPFSLASPPDCGCSESAK